MLQLTFNPGLTLSGFRTTRSRSLQFGMLARVPSRTAVDNRAFCVFKCNILGGQIKLEPRPGWSSLGVEFKFSDEHPRPLPWGSVASHCTHVHRYSTYSARSMKWQTRLKPLYVVFRAMKTFCKQNIAEPSEKMCPRRSSDWWCLVSPHHYPKAPKLGELF